MKTLDQLKTQAQTLLKNKSMGTARDRTKLLRQLEISAPMEEGWNTLRKALTDQVGELFAERAARADAADRPHFERLITELTGCAEGDGTLDAHSISRTYTNPHINYLWTRFINRTN